MLPDEVSSQHRQQVLIYGASGSVGTFAVQLARHLGAEVTGVCSTRNVDLVKSLGASKVIDYTCEDFAAHGAMYDVIFDAVGKLQAGPGKAALRPGGRLATVATATHETPEDVDYLKVLVEARALQPVIDRCYPLAEAAEAHRYVESGRKRGNLVITVEQTC